jgi:hypothetical protein
MIRTSELLQTSEIRGLPQNEMSAELIFARIESIFQIEGERELLYPEDARTLIQTQLF